MQDFTATLHMWHFLLPGDGIKRDPERENCAVLTIAAQTANPYAGHVECRHPVDILYLVY